MIGPGAKHTAIVRVKASEEMPKVIGSCCSGHPTLGPPLALPKAKTIWPSVSIHKRSELRPMSSFATPTLNWIYGMWTGIQVVNAPFPTL